MSTQLKNLFLFTKFYLINYELHGYLFGSTSTFFEILVLLAFEIKSDAI